MPAYIVGDGPRDSGPPPNLVAYDEFDEARADIIERIRVEADNAAMVDDTAAVRTLDALIDEVKTWSSDDPLGAGHHWFANVDLNGCPWHFWTIYDLTVDADEYNEASW